MWPPGMQLKTKLRIFLNIYSTTLLIIVKKRPVFLFYFIANEHWDKKAAVITGFVPTLEHFGSGPKRNFGTDSGLTLKPGH